MTSLYETLKASKLGGTAPDMFTALLAKNIAAEEVEKTISGIPPLTFRSSGKPLTSWQIDGNTVQASAPTPSAPVDVNGVGERTVNLFDLNATDTNNGYVNGAYLLNDGSENANTPYRISEYIEIQGGTSYTLVYGNSLNNPSLCFYDESKQFISGQKYGTNRVVTKTSPSNAKYMRISYLDTNRADVMLNSGSTALPYEPYGYKLPITCGSTTTPVYLSDVQSARQVKKLVLTGEEDISLQSINSYGVANFYIYIPAARRHAICTHFKQQTSNIGSTQDEGFLLASASGNRITFYMRIFSSTAATPEELQTYLAAQYAAGTPVTIWYVLNDPETGTINEPLMRIGDYADSISDAATIPTVRGTNTLTVGTTVQPSSMTITYKEG